jgi:hypothetical protein
MSGLLLVSGVGEPLRYCVDSQADYAPDLYLL